MGHIKSWENDLHWDYQKRLLEISSFIILKVVEFECRELEGIRFVVG